jgi:hypothetical protein
MTFFPTRLQAQWAPSRTFRAANSEVVTFVVVRHRSSAARVHRQSDATNRAHRVAKATLWPLTNLPGPGRSRMARASSIQFLSGSHSSADLQSVHARKHSALATALILAFVAKNPSSTALRKRNRDRRSWSCDDRRANNYGGLSKCESV